MPERPSLPQVLDRLTQDLVDALLGAIRAASLAELLELEGEAPAAARAPRLLASRPRAPAPPKRAEERGPRALPASMLITDPGAMLAALDRAAAPAPAATAEILSEPSEPQSGVRLAAAPAGEDVVRTGRGGVVLRRKR